MSRQLAVMPTPDCKLLLLSEIAV